MQLMACRRLPAQAACFLSLAVLAGCAAPGPYGRPGAPLERLGDEIIVCGKLYHTGAPVVLWMDPGGYDAYRAECRFVPGRRIPAKPASDWETRYGSVRGHLPEEVAQRVWEEGWSLPLLREWVDLFVIHYDACGTSRRCFQVLQDQRGLSVHFMLDLDGTIYQTLDLKERAWHAGTANDRSVGVEIANIGAYEDMKTLDEWYGQDEKGRTYVTFPQWLGETGIRMPDFVARPAREGIFTGEINGRQLYQYDFTEEQYESLIKLTATLCQVLPRIEPDYPRDADGNLRMTVLTDQEMENFSGLLGHWHITTAKVDPGPAFDWDRLITTVREILD
jgi:N-acetylmuramoyl-L-alanine amidase